MFTGIIEAVGQVKVLEKGGDSARLQVMVELPQNDLKVGDSVAVNGVCLTVTSRLPNGFWADVGRETLDVTTLGELKTGSYVNIERPMLLGGRLGGHLVQGHVDGIGKIVNIQQVTGGCNVTLEVCEKGAWHLFRYLIKKGSIAINGCSLTINECDGAKFSVFLIPHTIEATTFKYAKAGDKVNLEVDIIGKYVEKLLRPDGALYQEPSRVTEEFLKRHGF